MFIKTKKGAASLISYFLYIFVSFAVLGIIVYMVQGIIVNNQEKYDFDEMIKNIDLISNTIDEVSKSRFSSKQITIYNPDLLVIDCQENHIKGEINYEADFREDSDVYINNIFVYKESNRLYFFKNIYDSDQNIIIDCEPIFLNKGKTIYIFRYSDYNLSENKIILSIDLLDFNKTEE